ncbi:Cas9 endonuclease PAM-interacting domain-containing protein, partial [Lactiplantibacillus plantarum]|uniref:Cas9 endonuclease PAM-interacting domain-containing protein n=1 Tax=Lactiplantibacillus plantarum TaxID=1590 RepID=UPI002E8E5214
QDILRSPQIEQLEQQGMTNKQAVTKVIEPLIAANNKKMLTYEVLLPKVRFEQVVRDRIKGQTHRFALGTDTYYHNIQELYLPLTLQRAFLGKQNESEVQLNQNLLTVFDATLAQVNRYFPLYEMNKFKKILNSARDQIELLEAKNQFVKNKLVLGKQGILTNMFIGLHANASYGDLKVLGVKTDFGKLQVPGGIKLTGDAEIIYQSPTGLFERKIALKDL